MDPQKRVKNMNINSKQFSTEFTNDDIIIWVSEDGKKRLIKPEGKLVAKVQYLIPGLNDIYSWEYPDNHDARLLGAIVEVLMELDAAKKTIVEMAEDMEALQEQLSCEMDD